jgi:CBS domain-containing protein
LRKAIPVIEIMSKKPVTVSPDATVKEAAELMRRRDVGSLLVVSSGKPIGIVTEKDLVTKVVAADLRPSEVRVRDFMTFPVVTVSPYQEVLEAAKTMADLKIRRLAVVEDDQLVGLLTENDILKVWPALIEITRQRAEMSASAAGSGVGYCEACSMFSDQLVLHNGQLVCPECRED